MAPQKEGVHVSLGCGSEALTPGGRLAGGQGEHRVANSVGLGDLGICLSNKLRVMLQYWMLLHLLNSYYFLSWRSLRSRFTTEGRELTAGPAMTMAASLREAKQNG